jgi:guanine deaminase
MEPVAGPDPGLRAFRGAVLDFLDDPRTAGASAVRYFEDGLLVVRGGRVASVGPAAQGLAALPPFTPVADHTGRLIAPGFVDAHVHYSQTDIIASPATQLLDWLDQHTFPAESQYGDPALAAEAAEFFLDELLRNGTTTAGVFPTVHVQSVDALFAAAARRRMRMLCGKVMMDRNCPESLRDDAESSYADSAALIERWHGRDRMAYAVTPRFAVTSTERQLALAAKLLDDYPGVRLQTHLAENTEELRLVAELFPWSRSYLDVYDRLGLLRAGALFAHCIHLDDAAWSRLAAANAVAVHCPTSNLFLGSGIFSMDRSRRAQARVALGSDVGGGTSFSMLRTMHEAYKVARMDGSRLDSLDCFYLATLGGARALGMDAHIGNFAAGKEADFIVLRPDATPLARRRIERARGLEDRLFVLMMLGDDRAVDAAYVMGNLLYEQE